MTTEKMKEYAKKYRETHKEEIKKYQKEYHKKYQKEYRKRMIESGNLEYKEREKEGDRRYREKNREKRNEYQRRKRNENRKEYNEKARIYAQEYKKRFPEKILEKKEKNKIWRKNYWLKKSYGITIDIYNSMSQSQGGKCGICGEEKRLVVDHDHRTNEIRGLLCDMCNVGLGNFRDSPLLLEGAINYLKLVLA